jgi:hypothetical protein
MVTLRASQRDLASSDDWDVGDDEDDTKSEQGQLNEEDIPSGVMGTIMKMLQQWAERFWEKQMILHELTQLGWEGAAHNVHRKDKKYGISQSRVLAFIQPDTDDSAVAPAPTTYSKLMDFHYIVPRWLQMLQWTDPPERSRITKGCGKPQSNTSISCDAATAVPD